MSGSHSSLLDSDLFTFTVGETETKDVVVHSKIVSRHSEPLDCLMNGQLAEAKEKHALLPNVGIDTFWRFCEFVYFGGYNDPSPENRKSSFEQDKIEEKKELLRNAAQGSSKASASQDSLNIKDDPREYEDSEKEMSRDSGPVLHGEDDFGRWSVEASKKTKSKNKKIGWRVDFGSQKQIHSPSMAESEDYVGWIKRNGRDGSIGSRIQASATAFSERVYNIHEANQNLHPATWQAPVHDDLLDFAPVLLGHARLYVFADQYDVKQLKLLTLYKIHAILKKYKASSLNLPAVIELARFAFDEAHTLDSAESVESMRGLVAHYFASRLNSIAAEPVFRDLLAEGGPFVSLFWDIVERTVIRNI